MLASWSSRTKSASPVTYQACRTSGRPRSLRVKASSKAAPSRSSETSTWMVKGRPKTAGLHHADVGDDDPLAPQPAQASQNCAFGKADPFGEPAGGQLIVDLDLRQQGAIEIIERDGFRHDYAHNDE